MENISKYEAYAIKALREMGVKEDLAGFDYTVAAVELMLEEKTRPIQLAKEGGIYGRVAQRYGTVSWATVERGIRHSINVLLNQGDAKDYEKVIGRAQGGSLNAGAYLSAIANYVRLQAYEEERTVRLSPVIGYAQKGMAQVLVTGRDLDVQLLTRRVDVDVIAPEDKAEAGVFTADGETEDGMTILRPAEEKTEPEGWKER